MPDRYGDVVEPPEPDTVPDDIWAAQERARTAAWAVVNCTLCDEDGYRGGTVCDHEDHTEAYRRGVALCREALAKAKERRQS